MPENRTSIITSLIGIVLSCLVIALLLSQQCQGPKDEKIRRDTVTIVREFHHETNTPFPVPYRFETHTVHDLPAVIDTDKIVNDYFDKRFYADSLINDTIQVRWSGQVTKNMLFNTRLAYNAKFKERTITNTVTKYKNSLFLGGGPGLNNNKIGFGFYAGFETKQYQFGAFYEPIRNPQGAYFIISRRINLFK